MPLRSLPAVLALSASLAAGAQPAPPDPARVARAAEYYQHRYGFQGVIAIEHNHHLLFIHGYGFADIAHQRPFTPETRFPIGSLSKQFTAAAVLLLQQEGKLHTSDPIRRWYPQAPDSWGSITLRQLLDHTSGIPDFDFGDILNKSRHTPDQLIGDVPNRPLDFAPGTRFAYANINYVLLGKVIERASGQPYCRFLHDRLFAPLHLKHTNCDSDPAAAAHRALGYYPAPHGPIRVQEGDLNSMAGAGSLDSTAPDLIRWTEDLHDGKVLSPASLAEMTAPGLGDYGYGLEIEDDGADLDMLHTGAVNGFFSLLQYLPVTRTTVVVLTNLLEQTNDSPPGAVALDDELVDLLTQPHPILPSEGTETDVPEAILRTYTGLYRREPPSHDPTTLDVTLRDGHLWIANGPTPQNALELHAESNTRFYLAGQQPILEWQKDGTLEFDNLPQFAAFLFRRSADAAAPAPAPEPESPALSLDRKPEP